MERFNGEVIRENAGLVGWGVVGATILAVEVLSPQTLSTASDRILEGRYGNIPKRMWQVGAGVLFLHTMNLLPRAIDPIQQFGDRVLSHTNIERLSL